MRPALLGILLAAAACSRGSGSSSDPAMPDGKYDIAAPRCSSTDASPQYPDVSHKATLLDFANLTEHSWTIAGRDLTDVFVDADCTLSVKRRILRNDGYQFALDRSRSHVFEPAGCSLTVENLGVVVELSTAQGAPFVDQTDPAEDLPLVVTRTEDGTIEIRTLDVQGLSDLWGSYGCADLDQILWRANSI